jgi:transposase
MRYELADYEWVVIKPMLPNKPRGVPRVNDRRALNGILHPWYACINMEPASQGTGVNRWEGHVAA